MPVGMGRGVLAYTEQAAAIAASQGSSHSAFTMMDRQGPGPIGPTPTGNWVTNYCNCNITPITLKGIRDENSRRYLEKSPTKLSHK